MSFTEFLQLTKVLRMIYGRTVSQKFFEKNVGMYYDLDSASLSNLKKGD